MQGHYTIDADHLNRAVKLTAYFESHMNRIYACIKSPSQRAEEALAARLKEGKIKNGFTVREITRKCWSYLSDSQTVTFALETMEELGWVRAVTGGSAGRGRPTLKWEINPKLRQSR